MGTLNIAGANDAYTTPDHADLDIVGDIEVVLRVQSLVTVFQPSTPLPIVGKWDEAGNQCSWLVTFDSGLLSFSWSDDGTAASAQTFSTGSANLTYPTWVRFRLDVDDGGGNHVSTIDISYAQTDDPSLIPTLQDWSTVYSATDPGTTSIFSSTTALHVGAQEDHPNDPPQVRVRSLRVVADPFGTPDEVAGPLFHAEPLGAGAFTDADGRTWTAQGGAEIVDDDFPCRYLDVRGEFNAASVTTADHASLDIVGDIQFVSNLYLDPLGSGSNGTIVSKWLEAGNQRSYLLHIDANGSQIILSTSSAGTSGSAVTTTSSIALPLFRWFWLRVTLDVDDGAGNREMTVEISYDTTLDPDAVTWSTLDVVSTPGTTSIFSGAADLIVGGTPNEFSFANWRSRSLQVVADPLGTPDVVVDPRFHELEPGGALFADSQGRSWNWITDPTGNFTEIALCDADAENVAIETAPALSAATAFGAMNLDVEGAPLPNIEVAVIDYSSFGEIVTLDDAFDRTWQEPHDEPGVGSFLMVNDDPDIAQITNDRLLQFRLYGQAAFTARPDIMEPNQLLAPDEEYGENVRIVGKQHIALLDEAVVYPARGTDTIPIEDDRGFNWTAPSPIYDHSKWKFAKHLAYQGTVGTPYSGTPGQWPTSANNASWIGPPGTTLYKAPPGPIYYRKDITIPTDIDQICIYFSSDDYGEIYFDGLLQAQNEGSHWTMTATILDVSAGRHTIAVYVRNHPPRPGGSSETKPLLYTVVSGDTLWALASRYYGTGTKWRVIYNANQAQIEARAKAAGLWDPDDPGHWIFPGQVFRIPGFGTTVRYPNPASCLVAVYEASNGRVIGSPIYTSNTTWRILAYPPSPPGMTVGRVIRRLISEAHRRGALPGITCNFTDAVDSAGVAWPMVTDISTKVLTDYCTMFLKELAQTHCDLWMPPGSKRLHAWNHGTRGADLAVTYHEPTDPDDHTTSNITSLSVARSL